ncbi:hypothetical protein [Aneurinibacillus terranovensis]|uniref:hypothetical protein n=1 Tax=Aneurinibacillus terranovensis TaxID=278991 RepID=UPI00042A6D7B|nr:hypothetical protein [Aneurinibacillus terranovensis]
MSTIWILSLFPALLCIIQWKELRQASKTTKSISFVFYGLVFVLLVYNYSFVHVSHPMDRLISILEPLVPINEGE